MVKFTNKRTHFGILLMFLTNSGGGFKNVAGVFTHILKIIGCNNVTREPAINVTTTYYFSKGLIWKLWYCQSRQLV